MNQCYATSSIRAIASTITCIHVNARPRERERERERSSPIRGHSFHFRMHFINPRSNAKNYYIPFLYPIFTFNTKKGLAFRSSIWATSHIFRCSPILCLLRLPWNKYLPEYRPHIHTLAHSYIKKYTLANTHSKWTYSAGWILCAFFSLRFQSQ